MSDIHGCLKEFEEMLNIIKLSKSDKLIILGDNIDKGPYSIGVLLKILKLKNEGYDITTLKGNHEQIFLALYKNIKSIAQLNTYHYINILKQNGTYKTIKDFLSLNDTMKQKVVREIKSYGTYYIHEQYLMVHAGVLPNTPLSEQTEDDLLWIREKFLETGAHNLPYTVIFGHTTTQSITLSNKGEIWHSNDKIGIDCGCVFGGKLACININNKKEYYVDSYIT